MEHKLKLSALSTNDIFLPTIFVVFISSLSTVFYVNYYSKPSNTTAKWKAITMFLYLLSAISFILQLKTSWMLDFLHQFHLAEEPILWQRLLGDFILAHKLTVDTTENYWITSQLLLFMLSFVVFVNMYSSKMELRFHHILGYLALGLTGSYGGVFALFLVHYYNCANSLSSFVPKLSLAQFCAQVISTIIGCAIVVYLYDASVSQVRATLLPFLVTTFFLPFGFALFSSQETKQPGILGEKTSPVYFLFSLGAYITIQHLYMTYMLASEWMSVRTMLLVAFANPYQHAISVDLICCCVISAVFVLLELRVVNKLQFKFYVIVKALGLLLGVLLITVIISPGALLSFLLAYREITVSPIVLDFDM